jgi:hypothetical protein
MYKTKETFLFNYFYFVSVEKKLKRIAVLYWDVTLVAIQVLQTARFVEKPF